MGHGSRPNITVGNWTATQSYVLAVFTLLVGLVAGYLFGGSSPQVNASSPLGTGWSSSSAPSPNASPTPAAVDGLLEQLRTRPNDPELLANIGNQYYDSREYGKAIEYYEKSLKLRPADANVRTDMGTAIWYSGDADRAIREYETSLKYQPNHAQTLFNMGVVKWQGKQDRKTAIELWQKLLAANPNYPDRQKVEQMIQQVRSENP